MQCEDQRSAHDHGNKKVQCCCIMPYLALRSVEKHLPLMHPAASACTFFTLHTQRPCCILFHRSPPECTVLKASLIHAFELTLSDCCRGNLSQSGKAVTCLSAAPDGGSSAQVPAKLSHRTDSCQPAVKARPGPEAELHQAQPTSQATQSALAAADSMWVEATHLSAEHALVASVNKRKHKSADISLSSCSVSRATSPADIQNAISAPAHLQHCPGGQQEVSNSSIMSNHSHFHSQPSSQAKSHELAHAACAVQSTDGDSLQLETHNDDFMVQMPQPRQQDCTIHPCTNAVSCTHLESDSCNASPSSGFHQAAGMQPKHDLQEPQPCQPASHDIAPASADTDSICPPRQNMLEASASGRVAVTSMPQARQQHLKQAAIQDSCGNSDMLTSSLSPLGDSRAVYQHTEADSRLANAAWLPRKALSIASSSASDNDVDDHVHSHQGNQTPSGTDGIMPLEYTLVPQLCSPAHSLRAAGEADTSGRHAADQRQFDLKAESSSRGAPDDDEALWSWPLHESSDKEKRLQPRIVDNR